MNRILSSFLNRLFKTGNLLVTDPSGNDRRYGDGSGSLLHVRFNDPTAERAIALNPALKLGETYMDGGLDILEGSVFELMRLVNLNSRQGGATEPWMLAIEQMRRTVRRTVQDNTPARARKNVQHHYDLSAELYALFLDDDRQYSCAYFETEEATLEEASSPKSATSRRSSFSTVPT